MVKILGIDFGERRVGLAVSIEGSGMALARETISYSTLPELINRIRKICQEDGIERFVIGFPLERDGSEGAAVKKVRAFAAEIKRHFSLPIEYEDERCTSTLASRAMREGGQHDRGMRGRIDQQAAQIILQSYLDRKYGELPQR
ncbi:MAG: Holliday junction resolvase RuvX [Patescibacteria group bacterium]|nr:Holliday junction resolvase RuvX [Patescibacteria group bacterium]MDD5715353.1 Holliday junction resolvase RuvX [Patescibacteria group bacterium]